MFLPFILIPIIFFIVVFIIIAVSINKANVFKNLQERAQDLSKNLMENFKDGFWGETVQEKKEVVCEYCGSVLDAKAKKCPNCSASVKKK